VAKLIAGARALLQVYDQDFLQDDLLGKANVTINKADLGRQIDGGWDCMALLREVSGDKAAQPLAKKRVRGSRGTGQV
jgi:hypothetical protein